LNTGAQKSQPEPEIHQAAKSPTGDGWAFAESLVVMGGVEPPTYGL